MNSLGDTDILKRPLLALVCSVRCPGDLILKAYDTAKALREAGVAVIGGFHTPMEKECLRILLRGKQPVVVCPARSIEGMRVPAEWRGPIKEGRLVVASPFEAKHSRVTAALSAQRNEMVAQIASALLVVHAAKGGATEALCAAAIAQGKRVYTLDSPANAHLVALGARVVGDVGEIVV